MSNPRVLITTYSTAFLSRGGGELELLDLLSNLRQLGVSADIYGSTSLPLIKYDIVLHYSLIPSGMVFVQEAKNAGKKLVLMPALWWANEPSQPEKDSAADFFRMADVIVFKSKSEYENIANYVAVDPAKLAYCPWGVDPCFEVPVNKDLFKKTYKLDEYILCLGIIEETKNQLTAIHALKESKIPVVFIGDYRDRSYYESCVKASPAHFKFLPHMQAKSEILRSAIQNCKVFLEVSLEPAGFSAFEAALAKVPMVLSAGEWTEEHFAELVQQVDPKSTSAIQQAVQIALTTTVPAELYTNMHIKHILPQSLEQLIRILQLRP
jgi:glycosyltransferase involved in cell wall biosynthesis